MIQQKKNTKDVSEVWAYGWIYILRNHSRYDIGNSCASKRVELLRLPIGWKENRTEHRQKRVRRIHASTQLQKKKTERFSSNE